MPNLPASSLIGVDVGGTFTDCVAFDSQTGAVDIAKVPTTVGDQSGGVMAGLAALGADLQRVYQVAHGTTIATNAVIERRGAQVALVTTRGFRDVVELGRRERPSLYGLRGRFEPLVPRHRRVEVNGRIGPDGKVLEPLTEADIERTIALLEQLDPEAIAISLIHSYANQKHERALEDALRRRWPDRYIARSTAIYPELGEFERTSTAVIAAYIGPLVTRYFARFDEALRSDGFERDFLVVQSNGGAASFKISQEVPTATILSGPAAGIVAASAVARSADMPKAVSFDMGGTSADIAVIVDGMVRRSVNNSIGFRLPLQVPMVEINAIGAGGGSVALLDDAGILRVGPDSAGSVPGPVCYGRGGTRPTVTDAHVVLGHLPGAGFVSPDGLDRAVDAVRGQLAEPLGLTTEEAAEAVLQVVTENMAGAIRLATVDKGLDVRGFGLVAFGGAGPMHICGLMRSLGVSTGAIPILPGLTSALGSIMTDIRHEFVEVIRCRIEEFTPAAICQVLDAHELAGRQLLARQGVEVEPRHWVEVDMLYAGQRHAITVRTSAPELRQADLRGRFEAEYARQYGANLDLPVTVESIRSSIEAPLSQLDLRACYEGLRSQAVERKIGTTSVRVGGIRYDEAPVINRHGIAPGERFAGPIIFSQADTTILVEPGYEAEQTESGTMIVREA